MMSVSTPQSKGLRTVIKRAYSDEIDVDLIFSFIIPFLSSFSDFIQDKQDFLNQITRLSAQNPYLAAFCENLESKLNNDVENSESHQNSLLQFKSFAAIARQLAREEAIDESTVLTIPKDSGYANELQMRLKQLLKDKADCPAWHSTVKPLIKHLGTKEDQETLIRAQERFGAIDINRQSLLNFTEQVYARYLEVNKRTITKLSHNRIKDCLTLLRNPETTLNESVEHVKALIEPSYCSFTLFKSWAKSFAGCFEEVLHSEQYKEFHKRFMASIQNKSYLQKPIRLRKALYIEKLDDWRHEERPETNRSFIN